MRYISVFSGIEAASCAWEPLGWEPVAFSEIEPFPCAVLQARYPNVPNLGDITKIDWSPYRGSVDVVVGGSPCQSFSIAGGREGLDGESRLMYEYIRCIDEVRPRFLLWENVPGVFSVDGGRAFGILLDSLENLGYSLAWRTLDAQFVRVADRDDSGRIRGWVGPVAQRRRRVFLVGHIGDGAAPAAVLFERESVSGNTQSSREKRQELARAAGRGASSGCGGVTTFAQNVRGEVRVQGDGSMSGALSAEQGRNQTTYLAAMAFNPAQITSPQNGNNPQPGDPCQTLDTDSRASVVYALQSDGSTSINSHGNGWQDDGSALCASDWKGVGNQYVTDGKVVCQPTS